MVADIAYLQQSQQEINQLEALFARQRAAYLAQPMPDATQRVQWLKALRDLLFKEQQALIRPSTGTSARAPPTRPCSPRSCPACTASTTPPSA